MRQSVRLVLWFSIAILGLGTDVAATDYSPATEEMARWGVDGFRSTSTGAKADVEFFGAGGEVIATVQIHPTAAGVNLRIESPNTAGRELLIVWDEARGLLSLRPPSRTRALGAFFDLQAASWTADPELEALSARYRQEIALAALALDQDRGRPERLPSLKAVACAPTGLTIPGLEPTPTAIWCRSGSAGCRGFGTSSAASSCCEEAVQDAHHCCTNGVCWGCCRLSTCDKKCFTGDYFCFCGVSGYQCAYPDE